MIAALSGLLGSPLSCADESELLPTLLSHLWGFCHPRGNQAGREEAKAHGRSVGVPEPQLDWTD